MAALEGNFKAVFSCTAGYIVFFDCKCAMGSNN